MNAVGAPRFAPDWLALRESADAAARATALLDPLRARLPGGTALVIRDLGCGTGSMGRWLAGRIPGPQHWILHDHDPALLARAACDPPGASADGHPVTVETRRAELTALRPAQLAGTSLVTASALLDLLTESEVDALAAACAQAGCPVLFTLSVTGIVELDPADPLDAEITAAFNAHQRRTGLLGPDAVQAAARAFGARGAEVRRHPSPWRLGARDGALTAEWLRGRVGAAIAQRPQLAARAEAYLRRRLGECASGGLRAVVHHEDLLALPGSGAGPS